MVKADESIKPTENAYQSQTILHEAPNYLLKEDEKSILPRGIKPPTYIRHKWKYIKFKRLVKKGSYTSARLMAKILQVDKDTIYKWLMTKPIQEALASEINNFTSKIGKSKDWKAQAYLLDKIIDDDKDREESKQDLKQLIVINT